MRTSGTDRARTHLIRTPTTDGEATKAEPCDRGSGDREPLMKPEPSPPFAPGVGGLFAGLATGAAAEGGVDEIDGGGGEVRPGVPGIAVGEKAPGFLAPHKLRGEMRVGARAGGFLAFPQPPPPLCSRSALGASQIRRPRKPPGPGAASMSTITSASQFTSMRME